MKSLGDAHVTPADTGVGNRNITVWIPADGERFGERAPLLRIVLPPDHMNGSRDPFVRVDNYCFASVSFRIDWFVGVAHDCQPQVLRSIHAVRDVVVRVKFPSVQRCKNSYYYR